MSLKKTVCLFVVLSLSVLGCAKELDVENAELSSRKILVMATGEPNAYVWSMGGTMGAAVAFGLMGTLVAGGIATEKGNKFHESLSDYPLNMKIRDAVVRSLVQDGEFEAVPVCVAGESQEDSGCVAVPNSNTMKSEHAGQYVLAVSPCEYGLRNQIPYLALNVGVFDIDTGKTLGRYNITLKNDEIEQGARDLKEWTSNREELCSCLDCQIDEMAKRIVSNMKTGAQVQEEPAWVYMGCSFLTMDKCFESPE